jgi:HK97 family phage major capsid protein
MDEKELKRLKELQRKNGENALSEGEAEELDSLEEKKQVADVFANGIAPVLNELKAVKQKVDAIETDKSTDITKTPGGALHSLIIAMRNGDAEAIKALQGKRISKAADPMLEAGSVLVPSITESRIIELNPTYNQARQYMNAFPMSGNVLTIPKEAVLPTWTWGIDENTSITSSKPTIGSLTYTPKKGGALVVMTSEMVADANINIGNYVIGKIMQAKGIGEDQQFFNGTGSPFTGVFQATYAAGNKETIATKDPASITYQNLLNATVKVDQNYIQGACWFMQRSIVPYIWGLVDGNNRPIFQPANGSMPATLLGFPVVLVENAPTYTAVNGVATKAFILFGNLINSGIGDVMGMQIKWLSEATIDGTNLAQYDLVGVRAIARAAFNAGLVEKYAIIQTHA